MSRCGHCSKSYIHRQSLYKHKKSCKGGSINIKVREKPCGSGMLQIQNPISLSKAKQTYANHSSNEANDNEISKYTWKKAQSNKQHSPLMPSDIRMIMWQIRIW